MASAANQDILARLRPATPDEIPIVDVGPYFRGEADALRRAANALRDAEENIGFYYLRGHGVPQALVDQVFRAARQFHALPLERKMAIRRNQHNVGYMPFRSSVVRANAVEGEKKPNMVEAFFAKRDLPADHPDVLANKPFRPANQWPLPDEAPGFRAACVAYSDALEALGKRLLPVYATALDLPADFFEEAFKEPQYSLRLSHYPAYDQAEKDEFGIAPHTDSSFLTFLAQNDVPGLAVRKTTGEWIEAPVVADTFIVNSGDLLRRWTNDRFLSTPHLAINRDGRERYSIPFFFDCQADYVMECLPTCTGPGNPPKYRPTTYVEYLTWFTRTNYDQAAASAPTAAE